MIKNFKLLLILGLLITPFGVAFADAGVYDHASYYATTYEYVSYGSTSNNSLYLQLINAVSNNAPVLDTIADITINEGEQITLNPTATDIDGDVLTYSYSGWMDNSTYTTTYTDAGTYSVTVTVSDGELTDSQDVNITVNNVNRAPVIATIADITVVEGELVSFSPSATDPDGDSLTYIYSGWMNSNSYTSTFEDAGVHTVTVTVSDGELTDSQDVTVNVTNVNQAPVLDVIADISVNEGSLISFSPSANDPDGDSLTYTYSGWMTSDMYTSGYADAGVHTVTVTVSDGELTDSQDITVTVLDVNSIPTITDIPDLTFVEGSIDNSIDLDDYISDFEDSDADINWAVSGNVNLGISINASTHIVTITANTGWRGTENLTFTAQDSDGAQVTDTVAVNISPLYGSVSGRVVDALSREAVSGITVKLIDPDDMSEMFSVQTVADGTYTISNVFAQTYYVLVDATGSDYDAEYYDDVKDIAQAQEISVLGDDLVNIDFDLLDTEIVSVDIDSTNNLLSFSVIPYELRNSINASDVAAYFSSNGIDLSLIRQWDGDDWISYDTSLSFTDYNFDIKQGFFAKSNVADTLAIDGMKIDLPVVVDLLEGWNLIRVPLGISVSTLNELANQINSQGGTVTTLKLWNIDNFDTYSVGSAELDSAIEYGKGYFIYCDQNSSWTIDNN